MGLAAAGLFACGSPETEPMAVMGIEEVLRERSAQLLAVPGVVGTARGLCRGRPCIKVYVIEKTPELERTLPGRLDGYPVVVEESGPVRAR